MAETRAVKSPEPEERIAGRAKELAAFRADAAGPEDVEHLIDLRVEQLTDEISRLQEEKESKLAERKRWLDVTGGRSRTNGPEPTQEKTK